MKKFLTFFALMTFISFYVTAQTLNWQFANYKVINAGTQLQFDVEVKASAAGTFHRDLQIYFDYNSAAFGSDIVAGSDISYTPLTLMNASKYFVVNTADNTGSKFAIITEANEEMDEVGSSTHYEEVLTTYQGLLRFTIDILDNSQTCGIAFDQTLMNGGQYYQSISAVEPVKYGDPSFYEGDISAYGLTSISGTITYANGGTDPIANCTVTINDGGVVGSTMTDANGFYSYYGIADGSYTLTTTCSELYVYVTDVNDMNVVIDHILGLPLTDVYFLAGNVNGDPVINVNDMNLMIDNIVGLSFGYPIADWVFVDQTVDVTGGVGTQDYLGLMAGDSDGSY